RLQGHSCRVFLRNRVGAKSRSLTSSPLGPADRAFLYLIFVIEEDGGVLRAKLHDPFQSLTKVWIVPSKLGHHLQPCRLCKDNPFQLSVLGLSLDSGSL